MIPRQDPASNYYREKLGAEKLRRCYEIAPARVRQYLDAEIDAVRERITPGARVLELGCGYGRIMAALMQRAAPVGRLVGIDTSHASLALASRLLGRDGRVSLVLMDAANLAFGDDGFDVVLCLQNGISAFHVDPEALMREALRVTRVGGTLIFSTYSEKFWLHRLHWFRLQSEAGLLGEIDEEKTGNGRIVCRDGFVATTATPAQFGDWAAKLNARSDVYEVDESSLFCELFKNP